MKSVIALVLLSLITVSLQLTLAAPEVRKPCPTCAPCNTKCPPQPICGKPTDCPVQTCPPQPLCPKTICSKPVCPKPVCKAPVCPPTKLACPQIACLMCVPPTQLGEPLKAGN